MAKVIYTGRADVRELAADDLKKVGVEGFREKRFPRGVPVEVGDEVAQALIKEENRLFGSFTLHEDEAQPSADTSSDLPVAPEAPLHEGQDPANSNAAEAETSGSTSKSSKSRS